MRNESNELDEQATQLSRRQALKQTVSGTLAAAVWSSLTIESTSAAEEATSIEFVPENDYPFFGGELPEAYRL